MTQEKFKDVETKEEMASEESERGYPHFNDFFMFSKKERGLRLAEIGKLYK